MRAMRQNGCDVVIGQLRPVGSRPTAAGFEELRPCVLPAWRLRRAMSIGLLHFALNDPLRMLTYLRLVVDGFPDVVSMLKLAYIVLVSVGLAYELRRSGIRHVRAHHFHSEALSAMIIAGLLDLPYSFKCYTVKLDFPQRLMLRVARTATFVTADTSQTREFLLALGVELGRIYILRNSISLIECPLRVEEPNTCPPVILAVGRLDYKKGFHVLLGACALLRNQGQRFRCVIVGDGEQRSRLLELRRELGLDDQVDMVGSMRFSEVRQWYERATIMAMPSVVAPDGQTDGLPTVVIEAMASGVPVVGSCTAGIPEAICNGVNGFVVPAGSAQDLAYCLKELLSNKGLRAKFRDEGRRTAEREFDLARNARILEGLIRTHAVDYAPEGQASSSKFAVKDNVPSES
jgi:glycosyltransferase involved in cell wall biosynthesis